MKRAATLIIIIIMIILLQVPPTQADRLVYMNFEGFSMTSFSNVGSASGSPSFDWVKIATLTVSLPSTKYLGGITVDWSVKDDEGANGINTGYSAYVKIVVNGVTTKTDQMINAGLTASKLSVFKFTGIQGSTFTIDVYVEGTANDADDTITVTVNNVYAYTLDQDFGVRSKLTSLTLLAPGASGTDEGFQLNKTEILLPQSYSLSEGTISFWLKWDGKTALVLAKNGSTAVIGIDTNGYLYVKNSDGTTYTATGLSPQAGSYVPVTIAWSNGKGYIMVDNQRVNLNWAGNITIDRVGDINANSQTLIDEVKLYDNYIPPDLVETEILKNEYSITYNGTVIPVEPEGGSTLGTINVAFLDANFSTINSTVISTSQMNAEAPNGTFAIVLTRGSVSRTYLLDKIPKSIAFPATEVASLVSSSIQVAPGSWSILEVKTVNGDIAARIPLNHNTGTVTLIPGNTYLFSFEEGNTVVTRFTTASGSMVFYISLEESTLKPPLDFEVKYDPNTKLVTVYYYDPNGATKSLELNVEAEKNFKPVLIVNDSRSGKLGLYKFVINASGSDNVNVKLSADVNGSIQTFERVVGTGEGSRAPFPSNLVPSFAVVALAGLIPFFLSRGTEAWLMPLGAAIGLSLVTTVLGWVPVTAPVAGLIAALTVLGVLGMLIERRD